MWLIVISCNNFVGQVKPLEEPPCTRNVFLRFATLHYGKRPRPTGRAGRYDSDSRGFGPSSSPERCLHVNCKQITIGSLNRICNETKNEIATEAGNRACGIYIHIPFCRSKCAYCDFYSIASWDGALLMEYAERVRDEIRLVRQKYGKMYEKNGVSTVYFGGGTPSLLAPEAVERIINAARAEFDMWPDAEITIEANPGTVDFDKLRAYREVGVNRLSLGAQSSLDRFLKPLGRIHTHADTVAAVEAARAAGFRNISIDAMVALPGQNVKDALTDAEAFCALRPEHLSVYELTVAPGTPLALANLQPPDEDAAIEMMEAVYACLARHGYRRYEISNWSLPGYESEHNRGYWLRRDYMGIGAGAHSFITGERLAHAANITQWMRDVANGRLVYDERNVICEGEAMFETLMLGLRMMDGVCLTDAITAAYGGKIKTFIEDGLAEICGGRLRLTGRGVWTHNAVCRALLEDDK